VLVGSIISATGIMALAASGGVWFRFGRRMAGESRQLVEAKRQTGDFILTQNRTKGLRFAGSTMRMD
jgi:hypothetical protein